MSKLKSRYHGRRYAPEVISYAIWAYHRFTLSLRDVEELLSERGVTVSYESIRRWCLKFGKQYRGNLKRREGRLNNDIEICKSCGGHIRMIACIENPVVIEKILTHLDRKDASHAAGRLRPSRASPGSMKTQCLCEKAPPQVSLFA